MRLPTMGTGYHSGTTWLEHAEHPDLRPLRAVEPHRLAAQAAESAIELARCLRDLPTAEAAFAAYEWLRRPRAEMISGAAAKTNQAKAGKAAPGRGAPSPEQMFARVNKHLSNWPGWPLPRSARAEIAATFVLVLGVGVVWFTRKVVGVQDGTVLVSLVIVSALVYLVRRGDLAELRGPGGWAATFVQVAQAEVSLTGDALIKIQDVDVRELKSAALERKTDEPVLMDMPLGQRYAATEVSDKLEFLSRSPRFRLVVLVNGQGVFQGCISPSELKGLMQDEALSEGFINAVAAANTKAVFRYPGTLQKVMIKDESSAEALSLMTSHNLDAVAVVDDAHQVLGIVEREQLVGRLILSLVPH